LQIKHNYDLLTEQTHIKPPNSISIDIARFVMLYVNSCSYPCLLFICNKSKKTPSSYIDNNGQTCAIRFAWCWYRWRHKLNVDSCFLQCMGTHISIFHHSMLNRDLYKVFLDTTYVFDMAKNEIFR